MKKNLETLREENRALEKKLKADPDDFCAVKEIAYNSFFLNDLKKALKFYKKALEMRPHFDYLHYNVGNVYHFMKNNQKAAQYYLNALRINPQNIEALNNMGILYFETKQTDAAFDVHNKAVKAGPNHPEAYHHLGILEREVNKDFELSMWYLKKAIRLDYKYPPNHYQLALTYKKMKKIDEAKQELEIALQLKPNYKEAKKELGKI